MKATMRHTIRAALALLAVGTITVVLTAPALASHVVVRTAFPTSGTVGEIVPLAVDVRTPEGAPLPGTTVTYYLHMSFAGVGGEAQIGRAVTDQNGVATIGYQPRAAGLHELRMEYLPPGATAAEQVMGAFDVTGGPQLVRPSGGVDIPGINSGLLMAVLGTVWLILLSVAFRLVAIARAGGATGPAPGDAPR
jgi:hypothetical protein